VKGFDEEFEDIVDYILKITHRIWEEKGMGLIYSYYVPNVAVHTPFGLYYGRQQMLADSVSTLSSLPDRRLFAEYVIWSGNDEDGFHTSHRIMTVAHNTGYSACGPPTGRKVVYRTIANCFVKENRIVEEWVVRDELSLVRQLGFDEHEVVRKLVEKDTPVKDSQANIGDIDRVRGHALSSAMEHNALVAISPDNRRGSRVGREQGSGSSFPGSAGKRGYGDARRANGS
jgi:hypothetical protein